MEGEDASASSAGHAGRATIHFLDLDDACLVSTSARGRTRRWSASHKRASIARSPVAVGHHAPSIAAPGPLLPRFRVLAAEGPRP